MTINNDNQFFATFLQCVALTMKSAQDSMDFEQAVNMCLTPDLVLSHFLQHGVDGVEVTEANLRRCAHALGVTSIAPLRTLADMVECLRQHQAGCVTDAELILALQCVPHQVVAVIKHSRLPYAIQCKISIADWDECVASNFATGLSV